MSWGATGWPSCDQRIGFLRRTYERAVRKGLAPSYWRFTSDGFGELWCCRPSDPGELRSLFTRDPNSNEVRLLGLPYFIEPDAPHPFALEVRA
jgi:hypothetical protein